jgi:hypothetical protein
MGEHQIEINLHFSPGEIKKIDESAVHTCHRDASNLLIIPIHPNNTKVLLIDSWVSYSYGVN